MKKKPMSLSEAIAILIIGALLGSVFVFGMRFWNQTVAKDDCTLVETHFVDETFIRKTRSPFRVSQIMIDCSNEERYVIDGCCINEQALAAVQHLQAQEPIALRIHPSSNTIVEFTAGGKQILTFDETMQKLASEANGFLYLGLFLYFGALHGLVVIIHRVLQSTGKRKNA